MSQKIKEVSIFFPINDLPSATNLKSVMFADDTDLLIQGNNLEALTVSLNTDVALEWIGF